jgi:glycosyltransferase involved in cell wall biosynthesis
VLATHAIQYQTPLYKELSRRNIVDLEVGFFSTQGAVPHHDPGFGITLSWDLDLLDGYRWTLLDLDTARAKARWPSTLMAWLRRQDIVVIHGHSDGRMLIAATLCRSLKIPYILRGESHADTSATGLRRLARHTLASWTVKNAAGALPIGRLNLEFYNRYGPVPSFWAPYTVDNERFRSVAETARLERSERLASLGLDPQRPVIIFSGKLIPRKRPLDAVEAIQRCKGRVSLLLLGDGLLRDRIRGFEARLPIRCVGFVNQADLPRWYACGDVLTLPSERETWGLTVNEGMACGLVPVVSDAVGCASDLVEGVGEVVPTGDIAKLTAAFLRTSFDAPSRAAAIQRRLDRFTVAETARGYEQATVALHRRRR